jgi:hypothetical protein
MIGAAAMAVAFFGVSAGVGIGGALPGSNWPGILAVVFIWLYFTAFSSGFVYCRQLFVCILLTWHRWISIPWLYAAEVNGLSMRGKAASLGKRPTPFDCLGRSIQRCLDADEPIFRSSNGLRLARQLPCRSSNSSRHTSSSMGLLFNLRRDQRLFVAAHILLPRRNSRPKPGRDGSMVPQESRLVRSQSQSLARSTECQAEWTKTRHAPERRGLRSDDGRLRARQR